MTTSNSGALSVLCVDDNEMVAEALRLRLAREPDLAWAGVVIRGEQALEHVDRLKPNIVLMDIDMPNVDAFAIVAGISSTAPQCRVIMFSGHVSPAEIDRALDAGAWGYLSKNDDVSKLIEGIRSVGRGEFAFSKEVESIHRRA